ncbi:metal ABC transporter solute-binding protein, Zn/Mn family [Croceiramulus getboli]|nr:zinc ABC transporter substrate-binding protein [Flavobacteriaceae bacterium YJPT1-3]
MKKGIWIVLVIGGLFAGCKQDQKEPSEELYVVTTTTMLTDLAKALGGKHIRVEGLMGSGVDPHLYKASEGDVRKLTQADVIFYNGLHLEGKLVEVFEKMGRSIQTVALAEKALDPDTLIGSDYFASNYDPHIWFDIDYWKQITQEMSRQLQQLAPEHKEAFAKAETAYLNQLEALKEEIQTTIASLPEEQRILVTAHDAFSYFGRAFGFEVVGLQGLSTATEAGVQDVQRLAQFIIDHQVKAIFVESSVPRRTIEALQAAVNAQDFDVQIGGTLFSDALGTTGTLEGTYIGMFKYNVNTMVDALR